MCLCACTHVCACVCACTRTCVGCTLVCVCVCVMNWDLQLLANFMYLSYSRCVINIYCCCFSTLLSNFPVISQLSGQLHIPQYLSGSSNNDTCLHRTYFASNVPLHDIYISFKPHNPHLKQILKLSLSYR